MKRAFCCVFGCMAVGLSFAAPVYLDCIMPDGSKDVLWNVTLDESAGTVSYLIPQMGVATKYPAIFTMDSVRFNSMTINRVDLKLRRIIVLMDTVVSDNTGQCKIVQKVERQF